MGIFKDHPRYRRISERIEARKDLPQAASLADYFVRNRQTRVFNAAWRDAISRERGWRAKAQQGRKALIAPAPDVDVAALWKI